MPLPRPVADFTISPAEPSTSDSVQPLDRSHDPGQVGIAWRAWDLGDGVTAVGPAPVHRYTSVGEHEIKLTLATIDGRVANCTRTVRIA